MSHLQTMQSMYWRKILEAQKQSQFLGLIPQYIVNGIHTQYTDPKERLYHILVEFLKQVEPRPTWTAIADALRSPAVNLPQLAKRMEDTHFRNPRPTTRDAPLPKPKGYPY